MRFAVALVVFAAVVAGVFFAFTYANRLDTSVPTRYEVDGMTTWCLSDGSGMRAYQSQGSISVVYTNSGLSYGNLNPSWCPASAEARR